MRSATEDLLVSLKTKLNTKAAKNVIIFIGDGMGPNTVTAARIYRAGESSYLSWERFPHLGALKVRKIHKLNFHFLGIISFILEPRWNPPTLFPASCSSTAIYLFFSKFIDRLDISLPDVLLKVFPPSGQYHLIVS